MRKAIASAGLTLAAVASAAALAAPASASAVRPDSSYWQTITTYWNSPGAPDANGQCNARGSADENSGVAIKYACNPTERTVRNETVQTGFILSEQFRIG